MKTFIVLIIATILLNSNIQAQTATPPLKAGEVAMKTGRMMVVKDGQWVDMEEDVVMKDGTRITPKGEVTTKEGRSKKLSEGECVTTEGKVKKEQPKTDKRAENEIKHGE